MENMEMKNTIAEYRSGEYGCRIVETSDLGNGVKPAGRIWYLREGWEPAEAGRWMDWVEGHWGLSDRQYQSLPIEERAALECREQVERWIETEFNSCWLKTYHAELYGQLTEADAFEEDGIFGERAQVLLATTAQVLKGR